MKFAEGSAVFAGFVACVVGVCSLLGGCSSLWDRQMKDLRDDPISSASWDGLELLGKKETTGESVKPPPPSITRCYKLTIPEEEAFEKVLTTATQHGWSEELTLRAPGDRIAIKELGDNRIAHLILTTLAPGCEKYSEAKFRITIGYR